MTQITLRLRWVAWALALFSGLFLVFGWGVGWDEDPVAKIGALYLVLVWDTLAVIVLTVLVASHDRSIERLQRTAARLEDWAVAQGEPDVHAGSGEAKP